MVVFCMPRILAESPSSSVGMAAIAAGPDQDEFNRHSYLLSHLYPDALDLRTNSIVGYSKLQTSLLLCGLDYQPRVTEPFFQPHP